MRKKVDKTMVNLVILSTGQKVDVNSVDGRPEVIKDRKMEDRNMFERRKIRNEMKKRNRHIGKGNEISQLTAQRDRWVFLLGIMPWCICKYLSYLETALKKQFSTISDKCRRIRQSSEEERG